MNPIETKGSHSVETCYGGHRGGNILAVYSAQFKPEPTPAQTFIQHVSQWFFAAKMLRVYEAGALGDAPSQEELSNHRVYCSLLITFGEFATQFARSRKDIDLAVADLSVESIEAETKMLRLNFRMFHNETISEEEAEEVLSHAFNEA